MFKLDCVEKFLSTAYTIFLYYVGKFGWRKKDQNGVTKHPAHVKYINKFCCRNAEIWMLKQVVYIITNGLETCNKYL